MSNFLESNFGSCVDLLIVLRNRFDVRVPSVLSPHLLDSFLLLSYWRLVETVRECIVASVHERPASFRGCNFCSGFPLSLRCSQERYGIGKLLCLLNFLVHFVFVWDITVKHKWSCVKRSLKCALSGSHSWAILWPVLHWHCLDPLLSYWSLWRILPKEFRVCHRGVIESNVVVHRSIEVLSVSWMSYIVIFGTLHIEIRNPS